MARLYPSELSEPFSAFNVPSEKRVYDKLAAEGDNSYYVFHDLQWNDPSLDDNHTVGQADFVIVRPEYGVLVLEVKGGRCSYRARDRAWLTENRNGVVADIRDPFEQAATAARVLRKLLIHLPLGRNMRIPLVQSAAIFPDCAMPRQPLCARVPAWRILDQEHLFNLKHTLHELFEAAFPIGERPARADGLMLVRALEQLWGIQDVQGRIRLDLRIKQSYEKLVTLSEEQLNVLHSLHEMPRVLVRGCAGSGKTTLAVHKAKMLAEEGKSVGLFCFNIHLSRFLKHECEEYETTTVGPVAELFKQWLTEAGVPLDHQDTQEWWDTTLPTLVVDHLEDIPHRFDALVIDEGQDIRENYWTALQLLLRTDVDPIVYIFADQDQNLFHGKLNLSVELSPYSLNRNIRNTNQVFKVVKAWAGLPGQVLSSGVDGPAPRLYRYEDEVDMRNQLQKLIEQLCMEGVALGDIVVLGTRSQVRTCLNHGERIGSFRLVETREKQGDLRSMTVHKFKGLEASAVILCELDDAPPNIDELLYVGLTRSTGLVIALATGDTYRRLATTGIRIMENRPDS